jgi:hypothetical protein
MLNNTKSLVNDFTENFTIAYILRILSLPQEQNLIQVFISAFQVLKLRYRNVYVKYRT